MTKNKRKTAPEAASHFRDNIRIYVIMAVTAAAFVILSVTLFKLTIVEGESYAEASETKRYRTLTTTGTRGIVMDANGIPLAYDEKCYDVVFYKDSSRTSSSDRAFYTNVLLQAIGIIEDNGGVTIDTFSVKRDDATGEYYYDFGDVSAEAKAKREARWRSDMYVSEEKYDDDPELVYNTLRERYQIPTELDYYEARKLLSIWQELQLNTSKAYLPVDVAYDVDIQTVAILSAHAEELTGVTVEESTTRVYPREDVAAHVVGYLGKISDPDKLTEYEALGYSQDSWVGVSGVEGYMESTLTASSLERQGTREVEVDSKGQITNVLSQSEAKSGNSVMLTINLNFQMIVEDALEDRIAEIAQMQKDEYAKDAETTAKYDEKLAEAGQDEIKWANSGAAVVIDVKTGKLKAMASYPSYDLNMFAGGISDEDYALLTDADTSEIAKATPLFNKAVSSKATPGSIFKMVTAITGLMEGRITLDDRISDMGAYATTSAAGQTYYGRLPKCWASSGGAVEAHADQTIAEGLKNSCNYFFYTVAEKSGIDAINKWGDNLGLDQLTGIEITGEVKGQLGGQGVLYDQTRDVNNQGSSIPALVQRRLLAELKKISAEREVEYAETELLAATEALMQIPTSDYNTMPYIRDILNEYLDIPESTSVMRGWDATLRDWLTELRWNPNRTVLVGIGQEPVLVTPVAVARYIAALANGGTVYNVSVVDKIIAPDGGVVEDVQPSVYKQLDIPSEYFDVIHTGMSDVVAGDGTASSLFKNWAYTDVVAGKTGTAQVSQIDLENNSWFVAYAPIDDPEIAVVVYIPNGWKASNAILPAQDIIAYYLEHKDQEMDVDIPGGSAVVAPFDWGTQLYDATLPKATDTDAAAQQDETE